MMKCMGTRYGKFDYDHVLNHRDGTILHHPCLQPLDAQICDYLCLTRFFLGMKVMKSTLIDLHIQKTIGTLLFRSHTFWILEDILKCLLFRNTNLDIHGHSWMIHRTKNIGDGTITQNKPTNPKIAFKCVQYDENKGSNRRTINNRQPWLGRSKLE
jgi:hypothetical protein